MENASQALIIAGAIILAVLIIGLGMSIFMSASSSSSDSNLDEYEITRFNSKFLDYEGTISGSRAMNLCETVRNHNLANRDDPTRQVNLVLGQDIAANEANNGVATEADKLSVAATVKASIRSGKSYKVTVQYDKSTGLICEIHLRDLNG